MSVFKRYGIFGSLHLIKSILYTKLFFSNAKIIRLPFDIRNKRYIHIGNNFISGKNCRIEVLGNGVSGKMLYIGNNVQINDNVHIACAQSISIADNVLIASKVFISDHNHGNYSDSNVPQDNPLTIPIERSLYSKDIIIEENVWIGEFVSILPGVKLGKGSIIGTMSVVTKDIPPYSIAIGSPARVIKKYNFLSKKWEKIL